MGTLRARMVVEILRTYARVIRSLMRGVRFAGAFYRTTCFGIRYGYPSLAMETFGNYEGPNRERRSIFIHGMDATCLAAVYIAILFILTPLTPQHPGNKPVDLPTVKHSEPMLGAHREDATIVTVTRDGNVFVGNTQVQLADLPSQIAKSLAQGGERKGILRRMPEQNMVTSKQ